MSWCWLGTSLVVSGALAVLAGLLFALNYVRTCNTREHINWSEREVILVTGGAHGVGKRLVETLVDKYSPKKVIVLDISPATFQNDKVVWYSCDLSKRDNIKEVAERILADHGCPTILVNNAGIYKGKQFLEKNDRDIEMTMDVNLMAPIWVTSIFLPKMGKLCIYRPTMYWFSNYFS